MHTQSSFIFGQKSNARTQNLICATIMKDTQSCTQAGQYSSMLISLCRFIVPTMERGKLNRCYGSISSRLTRLLIETMLFENVGMRGGRVSRLWTCDSGQT